VNVVAGNGTIISSFVMRLLYNDTLKLWTYDSVVVNATVAAMYFAGLPNQTVFAVNVDDVSHLIAGVTCLNNTITVIAASNPAAGYNCTNDPNYTTLLSILTAAYPPDMWVITPTAVTIPTGKTC